MASQTRDYDKKKLLGQIYTPLHIVEKILTDTGFYSSDFDHSTILDPACGDGRFLIPAAQFIIKNSTPNEVEKRLENIYGWDIDPDAINMCRQNLDDLVVPLGLKISWNLFIINALEQIDSTQKFDLIIGNPPYIRIQHLPISQRQYVQTVYSFCNSGSTDAYVAFFS
nr:N-6 DNA methylase [Dyadobacter sp. NIV53]